MHFVETPVLVSKHLQSSAGTTVTERQKEQGGDASAIETRTTTSKWLRRRCSRSQQSHHYLRVIRKVAQ